MEVDVDAFVDAAWVVAVFFAAGLALPAATPGLAGPAFASIAVFCDDAGNGFGAVAGGSCRQEEIETEKDEAVGCLREEAPAVVVGADAGG